jgi:hypothetical protein
LSTKEKLKKARQGPFEEGRKNLDSSSRPEI